MQEGEKEHYCKCGKLELDVFYNKQNSTWELETHGEIGSCFSGIEYHGKMGETLEEAKKNAANKVKKELLEALEALED